ncbi:MAG: GNAT family N-acetyltransferase [Eggerthellaceae bacterium]|nr:GNAT family N-acetyltransferase [Eggerthellaceae bacterium]
MLNFEPYTVETLEKYLPYIRRSTSHCSEFSAGSQFMWNEGVEISYCLWNDTFVMSQLLGGQRAFSWPIGKDPDGMIDKLLVYTKQNHLPLRFFAATEDVVEKVKSDPRLAPASFDFDVRWSDYVYSFEEAHNFAGKKFAGQRNHINKFVRLYGEPDVRVLSAKDKPKLDKMIAEYERQHATRNTMEQMELSHAKELLSSFERFGLIGACLYVKDDIVAVSIGEVIGNMLLIHIEKALKEYEGAYPVMYRGLVRKTRELLGHPLVYINREDDSGDIGLRTSKRQYHPVFMLNKYVIHINSPVAQIKQLPVLESNRVVLDEIKETDKEAYLELCSDVENNKYWGYDYREDPYVTGPLTPDTFYSSMAYDMRIGDSLNFAIRLGHEGDLIGECILWNFSQAKDAELGCRLIPRYHGLGYGKEAFGLAASYAKEVLGLNVNARCFKENEASRRMILDNDFVEINEDETFYYFKQP